MLLCMFAPWAGVLTLVLTPLLLLWALWRRRWAVTVAALGVLALPLAWSWFFPLRSWFISNWAAAGKFPDGPLSELAPGLSLLALLLPAGVLLRAAWKRRVDAWPALLLLLAALAALLHVWFMLRMLWPWLSPMDRMAPT